MTLSFPESKAMCAKSTCICVIFGIFSNFWLTLGNDLLGNGDVDLTAEKGSDVYTKHTKMEIVALFQN